MNFGPPPGDISSSASSSFMLGMAHGASSRVPPREGWRLPIIVRDARDVSPLTRTAASNVHHQPRLHRRRAAERHQPALPCAPGSPALHADPQPRRLRPHRVAGVPQSGEHPRVAGQSLGLPAARCGGPCLARPIAAPGMERPPARRRPAPSRDRPEPVGAGAGMAAWPERRRHASLFLTCRPRPRCAADRREDARSHPSAPGDPLCLPRRADPLHDPSSARRIQLLPPSAWRRAADGAR